MGEIRKTLVRIGGRDYMMRGFESEEYIHKVAIFVDKKMAEISKCQPSLSTSMLMVLTAINLADEVIKLKAQTETLEQQITDMKSVISKTVAPTLVDSRKMRTGK
jgi:cell division protein ZapA